MNKSTMQETTQISRTDSSICLSEDRFGEIENHPEEIESESFQEITNKRSRDPSETCKRQRSNSNKCEFQNPLYSGVRFRTFRFSTFPNEFKRELATAGFSSCKDPHDLTICLACGFICYKWNECKDDPAIIHKTLQPNCWFVRTELKHIEISPDDVPHNEIKPVHRDFLDRSIRSASFDKSEDGETFASAGFFRCENGATCFYCGGSLPIDSFRFHPLMEHVRHFPDCCFAKNLCGDDLYETIRRFVRLEKFTDWSINSSQPLSDMTNTESTEYEVIAYFDYYRSFGNHWLNEPLGELAKQCIRKDLYLSRGNYQKNSVDLWNDCRIAKCRRESLENHEPLIPQVATMKKFAESQFPFPVEQRSTTEPRTNSTETFENFALSFPVKLKEFKKSRSSDENLNEKLAREISGRHSRFRGGLLSRFLDAGWTFSRSGDRIKCCSCRIEFDIVEFVDDPMQLHEMISPNCLFALALQKSNTERKTGLNTSSRGLYWSDDVTQMRQTIVNSKVKLSPSNFREIRRRVSTFNPLLSSAPTKVEELVKAGFYYSIESNQMLCFYCGNSKDIPNGEDQRSTDCWTKAEHNDNCGYHQQNQAEDAFESIRPHSNKCGWCEVEDSSQMPMPCCHRSMCENCCQIRFHCPRCYTPAIETMKIFF